MSEIMIMIKFSDELKKLVDRSNSAGVKMDLKTMIGSLVKSYDKELKANKAFIGSLKKLDKKVKVTVKGVV